MDRPLFLAWGCNRILCAPEHILADLHGARSDPGVHGLLDGSFHAEYRVDSAGRILRDRRPSGSPGSYTQLVYGYDRLGRLSGQKDASNLSWNCGGSGSFDPNYGYIGCPIDTVTAPRYLTYDGAGNSNASWVVRGTGDQLTTDGISGFTWDADGNLATRTFSSGGIAERDYSWSAENRLVKAIISGDSVRFDYDPLGQPVVRRGLSGEGMRVTLYDGGSILADLDSAGNRVGEYVYDQGTDRPYALLKGATTVTGAQYLRPSQTGVVAG